MSSDKPRRVILIDRKKDFQEIVHAAREAKIIKGSDQGIDISLTDEEVSKLIGKD